MLYIVFILCFFLCHFVSFYDTFFLFLCHFLCHFPLLCHFYITFLRFPHPLLVRRPRNRGRRGPPRHHPTYHVARPRPHPIHQLFHPLPPRPPIGPRQYFPNNKTRRQNRRRRPHRRRKIVSNSRPFPSHRRRFWLDRDRRPTNRRPRIKCFALSYHNYPAGPILVFRQCPRQPGPLSRAQ